MLQNSEQFNQVPKLCLGESIGETELKIIKRQRKQLVWTYEENEVYVDFLKKNKSSFINQKVRRKQKVFTRLREIIQSRTSQQCRSHHQRMIVTHKKISKIIKHIENILFMEKGSSYLELQTQNSVESKPPIIQSQILQSTNLNQNGVIEMEVQNIQQEKQDGDLWIVIDIDFWHKD